MRDAARRLIFHYRADGDFAENGISADRLGEIDTRYADRMFARLFELADQPLTRDRVPGQRLVGCCRDVTVLFLAIARHRGLSARARVGFATYFTPGWYIDHVIAEVWDAVQHRWRLVEPEIAGEHIDASDGTPIDPLDVPADRFLIGPQAWRSCRAGRTEAYRFVVDPGLEIPDTRGWTYVRHNLIHDLAALVKNEMLLWDDWGLIRLDGEPTPDQLALLDETAAVTSRADVGPDDVRPLYANDGFRIPPLVTSYSPAHAEPLSVDVRSLG